MKKIILTMAIACLSTNAFALSDSANYKVTITNITKGQPITPPVVASQKSYVSLFKLGEVASEGLAQLAKDGVRDVLVNELEGQAAVAAISQGQGPILPGQSQEIMVSGPQKTSISLAAMLARTNDAFTAGQNLPAPKHKGQKVAYLLGIYDAGAEVNTESCDHVPAPPCDSHGVGPAESGFVHPHPGVFGIKDLDVLRDSFTKAAAKVVIEKL